MDLRGIRFLSVCVPLSGYLSHPSGLSTRLAPSPAAQVASQGGTLEHVRVPVRDGTTSLDVRVLFMLVLFR